MKPTATNQRGRGQVTSECIIISVSDDDIADEELDYLTDEERGRLVGVDWQRRSQDVR